MVSPNKGERKSARNLSMTQDSLQLFFKLSELSTLLEVEISVLRYWKKEFKIKTLKMGSRKKIYRPQDLELFKEIKRLLYQEQYTIAEAKKHLGGEPDQKLLFDVFVEKGVKEEKEETVEKEEKVVKRKKKIKEKTELTLFTDLETDEKRLQSALTLIEETRIGLQEIKAMLISGNGSPQTKTSTLKGKTKKHWQGHE